MKNLTLAKNEEILSAYALSAEEMICIKGGDKGEPILLPVLPDPKL